MTKMIAPLQSSFTSLKITLVLMPEYDAASIRNNFAISCLESQKARKEWRYALQADYKKCRFILLLLSFNSANKFSLVIGACASNYDIISIWCQYSDECWEPISKSRLTIHNQSPTKLHCNWYCIIPIQKEWWFLFFRWIDRNTKLNK